MGNISRITPKDELINWLGKLPIQKTIYENGINYALSHAAFDEELYIENPKFSLRDALKMELEGKNKTKSFKKFLNCMWYREGDEKTHYAPLSFPKDHLMVVGHTKQKETNIQYLNKDPGKPVIYVDCGLGEMQGFNLTTKKHIQFEPKSTEHDFG